LNVQSSRIYPLSSQTTVSSANTTRNGRPVHIVTWVNRVTCKPVDNDRHFISPSNGALPTVLFLAARITDYSPSYPSNLDQGYLFTELKLYLSSTRAWPISRDSEMCSLGLWESSCLEPPDLPLYVRWFGIVVQNSWCAGSWGGISYCCIVHVSKMQFRLAL
jgi:hypothetical protein